jgi:hypothetical protein
MSPVDTGCHFHTFLLNKHILSIFPFVCHATPRGTTRTPSGMGIPAPTPPSTSTAGQVTPKLPAQQRVVFTEAVKTKINDGSGVALHVCIGGRIAAYAHHHGGPAVYIDVASRGLADAAYFITCDWLAIAPLQLIGRQEAKLAYAVLAHVRERAVCLAHTSATAAAAVSRRSRTHVAAERCCVHLLAGRRRRRRRGRGRRRVPRVLSSALHSVWGK